MGPHNSFTLLLLLLQIINNKHNLTVLFFIIFPGVLEGFII